MNKYFALAFVFAVVTGTIGCGNDDAARLRQRVADCRASAQSLSIQTEALVAALTSVEAKGSEAAKAEAAVIRQELADQIRAIRAIRSAATEAELQLATVKDEGWFTWHSDLKEDASVVAKLKEAEMALAKYEVKPVAAPGAPSRAPDVAPPVAAPSPMVTVPRAP